MTRTDTLMHASLWTFRGDPDDLLGGYDAMLAEIGPENLLVHLCLRTLDGIVIVDTCPTREAWEVFRGSPELPGILARHGLPEPEIRDYPVHVAHARAVGVPA